MSMFDLVDGVRGLNIQDEEEDDRLDLNTVNEEQLIQRCGLTELTAKRIIERRNILTKFATMDDLLSIQGINTSKLHKLKKQLVVHESRPPSGLPVHAHQISFLDPDGDHICQYVSASEFANISDSLHSKPGFIILHVNATSSSRSLKKLQKLIQKPLSHFPDIICVSDTGNHDFELLGYKRYKFSNQDDKARGKGVAIYVNFRSFFYAQGRDDLALRIDECDNLWLEANYWFFPSFVIGVIYRNPRTEKGKIEHFRVQLQNTIAKIKYEKKFFLYPGRHKPKHAQTNQPDV